jgi:hypothetical protein
VVYQSGVGAIGIPPLECPAARFPLSLLG